tara:strand:- start:298 stop:1014 length:717 start_codon:yes stop_codon:yes gene_type:complete
VKYFFYSFFILNTYLLFPQNIGLNGVKSDSRINDLFELIKNRVSKNSYSDSKIKGSEYFDEKFKPAYVKYFGKDLIQNIFLRYNAYSDEIEFTNNPKTQSSDKILMKNFNISCQIEGEKYIYTDYIDENDYRKKGYLIELFSGKKYVLYEKKLKIFMEGSNAKTSLERSFPPRFVEKHKYFISKNNTTKMEVKLNKKSIIDFLGVEEELIRKIIQQRKLKFKQSSDLKVILIEVDNIQ